MPNTPQRKKRPWVAKTKPKPTEERKERQKFYQTTAWRKLRNMFIKQHPMCVTCGKVGNVVDHIQPIRLGGDAYAWDNLQTMCAKCHNSKSGKEAYIR